MRIAITGASGLLGRHLIPRLVAKGHEIVASKHSRDIQTDQPIEELPFDLNDDDSIIHFVEKSDADLLIHSAAFSDVDGCDREPQKAERMNAVASGAAMDEARKTNMRLVYISTDYVFDGADGPYDETSQPNPINEYGRTKLKGEVAALRGGAQALVVRAAGFLGPGLPGKPTFAERTAQKILHEAPVKVAIDQKSNITPIEFLSEGIVELIEDGAIGIRHVAPNEIISRYEFASMLARLLGAPHDAVQGVPYAELNREAQRPLKGGLITQFPLDTQCPPLEKALEAFKDRYLSADKT
ncbi:MAG: sugar nucleotide-binding protein [candidate division Zixibacteria bacterium]|nr:sugar nucleotide-binding protein [candidate division Zixibacteria bacterium]